MKKQYSIISVITMAFAMLLSSCDKDANKPQYQWEMAGYVDTVSVSLYTPDVAVETDPLSVDSMLATSTVIDTVYMIATNKDGMALYVEESKDVAFAMPYLDENGEVRGIFQKGVFAQLYGRLKKATEAGLFDKAKFEAFAKEISVIKDTVSIGELTTSNITFDEVGASLMSWDFTQNSTYVKVALDETTYSRRSNIFVALQTIRPELEALVKAMPDGDDKTKLVNQLQSIWSEHSGTIKDAEGWMTLCYVNYRLTFDFHLEKAAGLLDDIAKGLYGVDNYGNALKPLWLVVKFDGTMSLGTGYERI